MAYSTQRVTSNGSLVLLSVSIGYLERAHIHVLFDNVENALPWAWVGPTSNQISFTPAVPNGVEVLVARITDLSAPYHVFSQGAQFTAESLDEDIKQILYISQEASEQASTGEYYQDINMHSYQVYNLGVTSDPTAAVSLGQYQADALGANVAKVAAQASQAAALVSQNAAAASEAAADISEANAAASAAAALVSENAAELAETNAAASAAAAATSFDSFDDRYLGAKASEPTLDNDGGTLLVGALFYHTGVGMKVWNGASWGIAYIGTGLVVPQDSSTGAADIPTGTTAQRPGLPEAGWIRRNTTLSLWEGYDGSGWVPLPVLATTNPVMNGAVAVGTGTTAARADHVHASDTTKANLASPTFTGVPAAPTATVGTNTTQLATTAFVQSANAGPVCRATQASLEVTSGVAVKVPFAAGATFDTDNIMSAGRITPTRAGYYKVSWSVKYSGGTSNISYGVAELRKNNVTYEAGSMLEIHALHNSGVSVGSTLVYCNGSTDYLEIWFEQGFVSGTASITDGAFSAAWIRT